MSEWIPVSERLPERNEYVLACLTEGWNSRIKIASLASGIGWYTLEGLGAKLPSECVLAWMPLPEPYEAKP